MNDPIPYEDCSEQERFARDIACECAEEELRDQGVDDEDFIACTLEDIRDGHSVAIYATAAWGAS